MGGLEDVETGILPELTNENVEGVAVDELHGVVMRAPLAADGEDRHDVGVVQLGGSLGLLPESLEVFRIEAGGEGEDLEGHATSERELGGLVDDAHSAAADLADDLEIAQRGRDIGIGRRRVPDLSSAWTVADAW